MKEQLRLGALHWKGHCIANTGGGPSDRLSAVNALKKRKTHATFLSTSYLNAECAQTHFCSCDVSRIDTPSYCFGGAGCGCVCV